MPGSERPYPGIAAVRGAVSVASNTAEDILAATARLLSALVNANRLEPSRIVSALFTATDDLDADFPAHAARRLGWEQVPLLCAREIAVPGAMPRVVRVLLTVAGVAAGKRLLPVYLDGARALRPDLAGPRAEAEGGARRRVAIVGLGQIGGSIGLALGRRGGWWRAGFDVDPRARKRAAALGAIDEIADSLESACAGALLAVVATPADTLPVVVDRAAAVLPAGAALVDTGSARAGVTGAIERAVARGVRAVGGHPLAGGEGRGLAAARAELFEGAPFVLCPAGGEVPGIVSDLVRDLGARETPASPDDHDRALARTSHLPYLIASALRGLGEAAAARGLSGPGFRDMTRLAASDPRMALAYCRANSREVAAAWSELRAALDASVAGLRTGH